jgi:hypothetical protein
MSDVLLFVPLVVPWDPILDPGGKSKAPIDFIKFNKKSLGFFLLVSQFPFLPFGYPLGSHPGSWWEKVKS